MNRSVIRWLVLCLGLVLSWLCPGARADAPVTLFQSFAGNVNFTGTEATMRNSGSNVCSIIGKKTTLTKTLSTIPSGATVLAAHLYWAGSGSTADYQVTFEGNTLNAQRQYSGSYSQAGTTYRYFGGAADVTQTVKAKSANGNGTYSFRDLTINAGSPWCNVEGVLGGFALLVIYSHPSQPFRVLNVYEGFKFTRDSSLTLNLSNFRVPDPIGGFTGRVGHITWEGDQSLSQQGETLAFNGNAMTDNLNPAGNQFASRSNINGDTASYGVDFDAYTIGEPIIKAGDTSATTTYASGQDLVWLNAEIVAVPNVPVVDLALSMTRTGEALAGSNVSYTLTVANNGPNTESAPLTVTDTIPPGINFVSATGTGWICSASGQTVTCTHQNSSQLAKGVSLPPIILTVQVSPATTYTDYTNTATVSGPSFDNISANNTATNLAVGGSVTSAYVFTIGACTDGIAIGATGSNCQRYTGPFMAATAAGQPLYITAMSGGVPTYLHKSANRNRSMRFSLSCVNPSASSIPGVRAEFAGQTLPLCTPNGAVPPESATSAWTGDVTVQFPGGQPSGRFSNGVVPIFKYADVGWVKLNLLDMDSNAPRSAASASFVSQPTRAKLTAILNSDNGSPNGTDGFARAGEAFKVKISVVMADGNLAPNFGKEMAPYGPVGVALGTDANPAKLTTSFALQTDRTYLGTADYNDVGNITLTALVAGKPDAGYAPGTYFGVAVPGDSQTVGRFYPGYLNTEITSEGMLCLPRMKCPVANETVYFVGAAYSGHKIDVTVKPFTLKGNELTTNMPLIRLYPVTAPGPSGTLISVGTTSPDIRSYTSNTIAVDTQPLTAAPTISLPNPFDSAAPRALNWRAPLTVYMRAVSDFTRVTSGPTRIDSVSSNRGAEGQSIEYGVQFIHGRLQVANAMGSELLKLPVRLNAQYWTGESWDNNPRDSFSTIDYVAMFSDCRKNLALNGTNVCKTSTVVGLDPQGSAVTLDEGGAIVRLSAPGPGNHGSTMVKMTGSPEWLPSTLGQGVFGVYKSPYIYIREVY